MPRDNTDRIDLDLINFDRRDWRSEGAPDRRFQKGSRRKDKLVAVKWHEDAVEIVVEDTRWPENEAGEYANLFVIRRKGDRWRGQFLAPMRYDEQERAGQDSEIGKKWFRFFLPLDVATLPDPGEDFGLAFHSVTGSVRSAIETYTRPESEDKPPPPVPGPGRRFPGPHPAPQLFYGPQVDRIHDRGVDHWVDFRERHGFHGILIPCANLPLDNTGIRRVVQAMPWTLIRLFGDEQHGQVPAGGLLGDEARRYYDDLFRILGDLGPDKWGATVGFDPFEWTDFDELHQWFELMQLLEPHAGRMIGARARTRDDEPPNSTPNPGSYKPWALRVLDKNRFRAMLREAIADSGNFPVCAEDGFRKRPGGREKDWHEAQMIGGDDFDGGFEVAMDEGVMCTWGNFADESGDDGCIDWRNVDGVRRILSPGNGGNGGGNGNGNGEPNECCVLACQQGEKIKATREGFERDVIEPVKQALAGVSFPPTFAEILRLVGSISDFAPLIAIAEGYGRDLREVEDALLEACEIEPDEPDEPDDGDDEDDEPEPEPDVEPTLRVLHPGTPQVQSWPIVQRPDFRPEVHAEKNEIVVKYDRLPEDLFPEFITLGELHHGNIWMVFRDLSARPVEWLRRERERNETAFPIDDDIPIPLRDGDLVGFFIAGPSRHMNNEPRFRQRTHIQWFIWRSDGKLERTEAP